MTLAFHVLMTPQGAVKVLNAWAGFAPLVSGMELCVRMPSYWFVMRRDLLELLHELLRRLRYLAPREAAEAFAYLMLPLLVGYYAVVGDEDVCWKLLALRLLAMAPPKV